MTNSLDSPRTATTSFVSDMRAVLHVITKPEDTFAREIISRQTSQRDAKVEVVDLTQPEPDYAALLMKIFAADSVTVW